MKRKHLGSKFEDFLAEDGILEECRASAIKFKIAHELGKAMNQRNNSKADRAKRRRHQALTAWKTRPTFRR